jgi:hypothetical protein
MLKVDLDPATGEALLTLRSAKGGKLPREQLHAYLAIFALEDIEALERVLEEFYQEWPEEVITFLKSFRVVASVYAEHQDKGQNIEPIYKKLLEKPHFRDILLQHCLIPSSIADKLLEGKVHTSSKAHVPSN